MDMEINAIPEVCIASIFSSLSFCIVVVILEGNQLMGSMEPIYQHKSHQQGDATFSKEDNVHTKKAPLEIHHPEASGLSTFYGQDFLFQFYRQAAALA